MPRVPQCLSPRPSEMGPPPPLPQASMSPPEPKEGGHIRLRVREWGGGPNSDDWRKSQELCLLVASKVLGNIYKGFHGLAWPLTNVSLYFLISLLFKFAA
jgi:hypothetical protein